MNDNRADGLLAAVGFLLWHGDTEESRPSVSYFFDGKGYYFTMQDANHALFEGILLLSDIDGTLLNSHKTIPPRNREAVRRFMREGGRFSLATGRCVQSARRFAEDVGTNFPSIVLNGAAVFDFASNAVVSQRRLPAGYPRLLGGLHERFPEVGIQVYVGSEIYVPVLNPVVERQMEVERLDYRAVPLDRLPAQANKILLGGSNDRLKELSAYVREHETDGMQGIFSETCYYEILPPRTDKGAGLRDAVAGSGIDPARVVAVGDYYNDVAFLKAAAHPLAAGNAPEEVRRLARFVTCGCDRGAVADAVEYIERELVGAGEKTNGRFAGVNNVSNQRKTPESC